MDPITQGLLGAVAVQALKPKFAPSRSLVVAGALSAMSPDLDIYIKSETNPLVILEYHRHFTHSLSFVPLGALICAAVFYGLYRYVLKRPSDFRSIYLACFVGFATHGLLDSCTAYGTQLLWPFSNHRVAWDLISIIDPFYTGLLLAGVGVAFLMRKARPAQIFFAASFLYLGFCFVQHHSAASIQRELAESRGHTWVRGRATPTFFNAVLFRSVYEATDGKFYADAIWTFPFLGHHVWTGESAPKFEVERGTAHLPPDSVLASDIRTFAWFSDNYLFETESTDGGPVTLADFRSSTLPHKVQPIWGIQFDPGSPDQHVDRARFERNRFGSAGPFFAMLFRSGNEDQEAGRDVP